MKLTNKVLNKFNYLPLRIKIWLYFVLLIVIIFGLLWFFQIIFLENFYEYMKINDVNKEGKRLATLFYEEESNDYARTVRKSAIENGMCIELVDKYARTQFSAETVGECLIHGRDNSIFMIISKMRNSHETEFVYQGVDKRSNSTSLVYCCELSDENGLYGYLFVNAPIEPVASTVSIIKRQLFMIIVILIALSFLISIYVSNKIATPIIKITKSSEKLAKGNYNVKFEGTGYAESQLLAQTLTYASKQIALVDTHQRDLIANVSHDLRTPLTMLKAYAEMIRDLSGDNPIKREEHLNIIIEETDRLALLVNDMLDLSKLESGNQTLTLSEIEINSELNDIIDRFKGVSEKMGYQIHFTPDEPLNVTCDIVKIEQVLYNLINNAINYTGKDKQVYVTQKNLPNGVRIEIRDTGEGISEDKVDLIFDKYYRSENHKREIIGTGLGLSIVKVILRMHNFDYGVDSVLGQGSTFWFVIKK